MQVMIGHYTVLSLRLWLYVLLLVSDGAVLTRSEKGGTSGVPTCLTSLKRARHRDFLDCSADSSVTRLTEVTPLLAALCRAGRRAAAPLAPTAWHVQARQQQHMRARTRHAARHMQHSARRAGAGWSWFTAVGSGERR
jgi:hypothetical protein